MHSSAPRRTRLERNVQANRRVVRHGVPRYGHAVRARSRQQERDQVVDMGMTGGRRRVYAVGIQMRIVDGPRSAHE